MRRNWMRLLLMFGPMIVNGISRYMNNRQRKQEMTPPPRREEDYYETDEAPAPKRPTYDEDDFV